jgi:hypothetical protein
LGAVAGVEFHHGALDVGADGVDAEVEFGGDLVVAPAVGGQGHRFALAGGEFGELVVRRGFGGFGGGEVVAVQSGDREGDDLVDVRGQLLCQGAEQLGDP